MNQKLSRTMQELVAYMRENDGTITRFPGGFWARKGWTLHSGHFYGTPSVQALVDRGVAEYTKWQKSRRGAYKPFPVEARLLEQP